MLRETVSQGQPKGQKRSLPAPNPNAVLALRGSDDLDLHGRGGEVDELLLHAVSNAGEHRCAAREDDVAVEVLADVDIALHDGVVGGLVDASELTAQEGGLEEGLGAAEALSSNSDDLAVGQLI